MYSLKLWTKGPVPRIYLNGPGLPEQTGFSFARSSNPPFWKFQCGTAGKRLDKAVVLTAFFAWLREAGHPYDEQSLTWEGLCELANTLPKRADSTRDTRSYPRGRHSGFQTRQPHAGAELDLTTIELAEKVIIRIDHREPQAMATLLDGHPNIEIIMESLPIGDYILHEKIVIERKAVTATGNDFEASVVDDAKRLFFQSEKINMDGSYMGAFLIEGDIFGQAQRMGLNAINGAVSYLFAIQNLSVFHTVDLRHSAYFMVKLLQHACFGLPTLPDLRKPKARKTADVQAFVLEGLPGVSSLSARTLIEHFGCLNRVINASFEELCAVKGIGPKTAERILAITASAPASAGDLGR